MMCCFIGLFQATEYVSNCCKSITCKSIYIFHLFIQEDYNFGYKATYKTNTNVYITIQIKAMVTFMMH